MTKIYGQWFLGFSVIIICIGSMGGEAMALGEKVVRESAAPQDVLIEDNGIRMPLGVILLARKDSDYCAIKFLKIWTGKTDEDWFASYEFYCQDDGTGDFSKENVKVTRGEFSSPRLRGFGRFAFEFGSKTDIRCGNLRLTWSTETKVPFYDLTKDKGFDEVELAPTIWTDVSQVNVFDPRITWYRYKGVPHKTIRIPLDKLWKE